MTFYRSYWDESGKFKDHKVVSFCGVMASPESRDAFNDAWNAVLKETQLPALHATLALQFHRNVTPALRKGTPEQRCDALKPFVDCILNHMDLGVALSVDVEAYSKWSPEAKKRVGGSDDPSYFAFLQAMGSVKKLATQEADLVSMMCDEDEETAQNFYRLYRRGKKVDPELKKKLVSISFSDDELFPALQAADLLAALVRLESLKSFGYHPHSFKSLVSHLMVPRTDQKMKWIAFIATAEELENIGNRLKNL